ncbi:hypothetical protein KW790_02645 [Candidatus Parcubacteria bacterium]|nr:hypothetical protein [Candidatus Parcubacteria bacterium]
MKQGLKTLIAILVLVLAGFGIYKYPPVRNLFNKPAPPETSVNTPKALTTNDILAVFPPNIPIEISNVTEKNKTDYGTTIVYSLAYRSAWSVEDLYKTYGTYFSKSKLYIIKQKSSPSLSFYDVKVGNDELSIYISPESNHSLVKLALAHKK